MKHETHNLVGWLDGGLDADTRRRVEEHLEECPECRRALAGLRIAGETLRAHAAQIPTPDFDPAMWSRVRARVAPAARRPMVSRWVMAAGGLASAAILSMALFTSGLLPWEESGKQWAEGPVPDKPSAGSAPTATSAPSAAAQAEKQAARPGGLQKPSLARAPKAPSPLTARPPAPLVTPEPGGWRTIVGRDSYRTRETNPASPFVAGDSVRNAPRRENKSVTENMGRRGVAIKPGREMSPKAVGQAYPMVAREALRDGTSAARTEKSSGGAPQPPTATAPGGTTADTVSKVADGDVSNSMERRAGYGMGNITAPDALTAATASTSEALSLLKNADAEFKRGRAARSIQIYRAALRAGLGAPENRQAYLRLGDAHMQTDAPEEALHEYTTALNLGADREVWDKLGTVYDRLGDRQNALVAYRNAERFAEGPPPAATRPAP